MEARYICACCRVSQGAGTSSLVQLSLGICRTIAVMPNCTWIVGLHVSERAVDRGDGAQPLEIKIVTSGRRMEQPARRPSHTVPANHPTASAEVGTCPVGFQRTWTQTEGQPNHID